MSVDITVVKPMIDYLDTIEYKLNHTALVDAELDVIESAVTTSFTNLSLINDGSIPVTAMSIRIYSLIDNKRIAYKTLDDISYPPEYVFPRNPNLTQYVVPEYIDRETYYENGNGLSFEFGFTGTLNIIRTKYPPYLDKQYFNFTNRTWTTPQLTLTIVDNINIEDVTPYFSNSIVNFSGTATGINDKILYYFDGEKIVTNFDFSNVTDRKKVFVSYKKLLKSVRVKSIMQTNLHNLSFFTPTVDQYTLLVDKQRVLS